MITGPRRRGSIALALAALLLRPVTQIAFQGWGAGRSASTMFAMTSKYLRILPLVLWVAMIAGAAAPLAATARDQRMDPAEREELRAELRDRYHQQRQRSEPRRQRGPQGDVQGARSDAPEPPAALPRQRLSREEMRVLRQQLRDQRQGESSVPGERRDRGSRNQLRDRGNGGERGDRGEVDESGDGWRRSRWR